MNPLDPHLHNTAGITHLTPCTPADEQIPS